MYPQITGVYEQVWPHLTFPPKYIPKKGNGWYILSEVKLPSLRLPCPLQIIPARHLELKGIIIKKEIIKANIKIERLYLLKNIFHPIHNLII